VLSNIRVVLVETSHPGNIGAVARAMKNMGLKRLYLVRPQSFPHPEATSRASGADDVLADAVVCNSLDEALSNCSLVCGASARQRTIPWPQVDARRCGELVVVGGSHIGEVALVFGRESVGLTNAELERCNYLVHIPSNPGYSSLNIAAAVQVIAYEVRMAVGPMLDLPMHEHGEEAPASMEELEGLYHHLEQALVELEFLDPDNPRQLMRRLRRLFNRARLEPVEVNILRGILTAAQKKARGIRYS